MLLAKNRLTGESVYSWDVEINPSGYKGLIKSKQLVCHYCDNPAHWKHGKVKISHFAHYEKNIDCPSFHDDPELLPFRKVLYDYLSNHYDQIELESYLPESSKIIDCTLVTEERKIAWLIYRKGMRNWDKFKDFLKEHGYTNHHVFFAKSFLVIDEEDLTTSGRGMFGDLITGEYNLRLSPIMNKMLRWSNAYKSKFVQLICSNTKTIINYSIPKNSNGSKVFYKSKHIITNLQTLEDGELIEKGSGKKIIESPKCETPQDSQSEVDNKLEQIRAKYLLDENLESGDSIADRINRRYSPNTDEEVNIAPAKEEPPEDNQLNLF